MHLAMRGRAGCAAVRELSGAFSAPQSDGMGFDGAQLLLHHAAAEQSGEATAVAEY